MRACQHTLSWTLLRSLLALCWLVCGLASAQGVGDTATPEMRREWSDASQRLRETIYPEIYGLEDPAAICRGLLEYLGEHTGLDQRVLFHDVVHYAERAGDLDLLLEVYEDVGARSGSRGLSVGRVLDLFASAMPAGAITAKHVGFLPDLLRLSEEAVQAADFDAARCGHGLVERILAATPAADTAVGKADVRAVRDHLRALALDLDRMARLAAALGRSPGSGGAATAGWGAGVDVDADPLLAQGMFALLVQRDLSTAIDPLRACGHALLASLAAAEFDLVDTIRSHGVLADRTRDLAKRWWTEAQRENLLGGSRCARQAFAQRALEHFRWCAKSMPIAGDRRVAGATAIECQAFLDGIAAPDDAIERIVARAALALPADDAVAGDAAPEVDPVEDPIDAPAADEGEGDGPTLAWARDDLLRGKYSSRNIPLSGRVVESTAEGLDLELEERLARGIGGVQKRVYRWDFGYVRPGEKKGQRVYRLDAIYPVEDKKVWERAECEGEVVLSPDGTLQGRLRWRTQVREGEWREKKHWSDVRLRRRAPKSGR